LSQGRSLNSDLGEGCNSEKSKDEEAMELEHTVLSWIGLDQVGSEWSKQEASVADVCFN
jgi:hypothetical protein